MQLCFGRCDTLWAPKPTPAPDGIVSARQVNVKTDDSIAAAAATKDDGCPASKVVTQLLFARLNLSYPGLESLHSSDGRQ